MGKLTPVTLDDGTLIYIEATENAVSSSIVTDKTGEVGEPKRGLLLDDAPKQIAQSFQAMEDTIRAYTDYTLKAFRNLAIAEVSEVTLKFGVNVDIQTGLPYIANVDTPRSEDTGILGSTTQLAGLSFHQNQ